MNLTDVPMAGSVMDRAPLRRQQGGDGGTNMAGINKDELVGPFWVEDGLKQLPELLPFFRRQFPQAVVQEKVCIFQEDHNFYAGQCSILCIRRPYRWKNNDVTPPFLFWTLLEQ